jgi:hypothetical protein
MQRDGGASNGSLGQRREQRILPQILRCRLGIAAMIEQSEEQFRRYGVPFIFPARPGTYGSAGKHYDIRHTPLEAKLMASAIDTLTSRYHIGRWVLGGHRGGGTFAAVG